MFYFRIKYFLSETDDWSGQLDVHFCYYNNGISLTPNFSGFSNMAYIFGRVLASSFVILLPNISTNEHSKTTPRPMTTVINIGDFRSLNMFLTSSPWCSCLASKSMVEFYRWSNKTKKSD